MANTTECLTENLHLKKNSVLEKAGKQQLIYQEINAIFENNGKMH